MVNNKVKCRCGQLIYESSMQKHITSKSHIIKTTSQKRTSPTQAQVDNYNSHKDNYNCCSKCLRIKIQDIYFNKESRICKCCEEISYGGNKQCRLCNETKDISLFERPYLTKCKKCAAVRAATKVQCECGMLVDFGVLSKHRKMHP